MPSTWLSIITPSMREWPQPAWFEELPPIAEGWRRNEMLADYTTIKVGGPAEVFGVLSGWEEAGAVVRFCWEKSIPLMVVGKGSNLMVRDGGVRGVVVMLGKGCDAVEVRGENVYAEAGAANGTAARAAREAELTGLEFFGGIPGGIGGALKMNAGAYGTETYDTILKLWVMDDKGEKREVEPGFVKPVYRHTELPAGWIYVAGLWKLMKGDKEAIRQRMREINHARSTTQPLHMPSSGSWFKNPMWKGEKTNAWKVVEAAGCRGMQVGGAQVSEQHANFFVNVGGATSADFEALSVKVEAQVKDKLDVVMEREVRWVGEE